MVQKIVRCILIFLVFHLPSGVFAAKIFFDTSAISHSSLLHFTLTDAVELFKTSNISITNNINSADWKIIFEKEKDAAVYKTFYEENNKQTQKFSISSTIKHKQHIITFTSLSEKGLSNALYYWMQNYLGFSFYHPKENIIPDLSHYIPDTFHVAVTPRFDKIGFHVHSQHPLEITEALLNEKTPNGQKEVKIYIDWLCRNGQNYFEFCLLRSVNLEEWIPYFTPVVTYAHQRGIICGLDLSFHMIQQRAFQLYKTFPSSFKNKDKQISNNIIQLTKINWDVWNVEFASNEFAEKNQEKLYLQKKFLYDSLEKYHIKLATRKHVVKDENLLSNSKSYKKDKNDMDSAYSIFVHTVMFYKLNDTSTPVYRNKDFSHIKKLLVESNQYRDTWYYPESAYWITFDNSVPMFLMPYLDARLKDIQYCDSLGIDGHVTFSSGWEWNYWLIDWSIARWCWKEAVSTAPSRLTTNKEAKLQYLQGIVNDSSFIRFANEVSDLQTKFIKNKELIKVMDAQTITDEIGGKLNLEFHPRPEYPYKYIMNKATTKELDFIQQKYINGLTEFVRQYYAIRSKYNFTAGNKITDEMLNSLDVVALRAEHRKSTLSYLIAYRLNKLNKTNEPVQQYLDNAKAIREKALGIVKAQEKNYRYPTESIAVKKISKTVYNFGYLYTVSNLHFWEREELQAKNNKWKFWYQNIWDVLKIIGVKK
ncbi:MAG: hypothetical protein JWN78_1594 [Bacteroidota bacterium]|nr:hypothetical protein [Bacteroidota bacterium]